MLRRSLALALAAVLAAGCGSGSPGSEQDGARSDIRQTAFRVRPTVDVPLNADFGWAASQGEPATVPAERPFRIRFEVEMDPVPASRLTLRLEYRRNGGTWAPLAAEDFPYPARATPPVSIVAPSGYPVGAATEDVLTGSPSPFVAGTGVALDSVVSTHVPGGDAPLHTELEWPVVIRRFADGAVTNEDGDHFEFRLTDDAGRPLSGAPRPAVTLAVPHRLLAGTFVETPERIGPWQTSDGSLYFIMEPSESDNVLMVVRSTDGGATWSEVDGRSRPATGDLEGFATAFRDGRIHMLHQTSDAVFYHAFATGDDTTTPDRWVARDELVAEPEEPPTQVAALQARSDGSLVGVYGGPVYIHYRIRSLEGTWGPETIVDEGLPIRLSGPQTALGAEDVVHLAYTGQSGGEGTLWYRRIAADGSLGPRVLVSTGLAAGETDVGAVAPLVWLPESRTVVMLYRRDGDLWERRIMAQGSPTVPMLVSERSVVQSAVDSDQVGADAIADGERVHVLFIDEDSGGLFHTVSEGPGVWTPARLVQGGIRAQWVRGNRLLRPDGTAVYGFVYDAGSYGGSGMNRYGEVALPPE